MKKQKRGKKANSHSEFQFNKRNMLLNSKRSQGHIEVIISFVIFIGFLLFVFIFLNPFARTKEPSYIMDNIQKAIINNITDEVGKLRIIVNQTTDCYNSSKVLNYGNKFVEVRDSKNPRLYTIYFGDFFSGTLSCSPLGKNYTLGMYSKEKMVIYDKISDLKGSYNVDYKNLKISLGITNDFLFKTRNLIGEETPELSVTRNIPKGIDVESREIPIRVINNSNGQIQELILNIIVW